MQLEQVYSTYDWRDNRGFDNFLFCPRCGTRLKIERMDQTVRPVCPGCSYICYRNPYPAVTVLVPQGGTVLLGKRLENPGKGKWALPSGYIEFEEDFISAAIREVKEETGLDVDISAILNVHSAFLPPDFHFFCICLLGEVTGGELCPGDDLEDVSWFPATGPLPEISFDPDLELIQAYALGGMEKITIHRPGQVTAR